MVDSNVWRMEGWEEPTGRPSINSQEPVSDHSSRSSRIRIISNSVVIISGEFQQLCDDVN